MLVNSTRNFSSLLLVTGFALVVGCGTAVTEQAASDANDQEHTEIAEHKEHDHSGWWCDEHGVPEEVCTRCNNSLVADFKEKDDWCDEHSRPDSQCFLCNPELQARFAARYEAKFGEQPPKPADP